MESQDSHEEKKVEMMIKIKRRAKNVFAESLNLESSDFQKKVIDKNDTSKEIISLENYHSIIYDNYSIAFMYSSYRECAIG